MAVVQHVCRLIVVEDALPRLLGSSCDLFRLSAHDALAVSGKQHRQAANPPPFFFCTGLRCMERDACESSANSFSFVPGHLADGEKKLFDAVVDTVDVLWAKWEQRHGLPFRGL